MSPHQDIKNICINGTILTQSTYWTLEEDSEHLKGQDKSPHSGVEKKKGKTYAEIGQQFSSIFFNKVGLKIQTPTFYLSLGVILQSVFVSSLIQGIWKSV